MTRSHSSIGTRFILFISLAVLLFMAATFFISRDMLKKSALGTAGELASTILDQTDKRLGQFFDELHYLALGLAGTKAVEFLSEPDMKDLFLSTVRARSHYLRAIYVGTKEGRMMEWGLGAGFVDNAPVFPPGYDPRLRPWYRSAVENRGFTISSPYIYASVNELGITCALPLTDSSGELAGVLGLDILLEDLTRILEGLQIPKEGKALLLSPEGRIVASQFPEFNPAKPGLDLKPFDLAGGESVLADDSGSFTSRADGQVMHFVYRKASRSDWIIVVGMPYESIMESTRGLLNAITLIDILLMALLAISIAGITGRVIIAPLGHMVAVINRIEGGERKVRVEVKSGDEFGLLGREFNRLVDTVEENSRDLEEKVRRRTEELEILQKENTQLRIYEERQRIYRDLHDTIGAKLTNIFFCNAVAKEMAAGSGGEASVGRLPDMFGKVEENCLAAVQCLKDTILGMSEGTGSAYDLTELLGSGIRQRLEASGIAYEPRFRNRSALAALSPEAAAEIGKVVEELVSNVLKHASASQVRLIVDSGRRGLSLRFSDDGAGFDPESACRAGSGLANIRYRIKKLGGRMRLLASPGAGARYFFSVPMHPSPALPPKPGSTGSVGTAGASKAAETPMNAADHAGTESR